MDQWTNGARRVAAVLVIAVSMLGLGCQLMHKTGWMLSTNPYEGDAGSAALGEPIYAAHCASCHGPKGFGDGPMGKSFEPPPTNLRAYIVEYGTAHFAAHVAYGKTGNPAMPAFIKTLSEDEVWHVTNYVFSLGGVQESPAGADRSSQPMAREGVSGDW